MTFGRSCVRKQVVRAWKLLIQDSSESMIRSFTRDEDWYKLENLAQRCLHEMVKRFKARNTWTQGHYHERVWTRASLTFVEPGFGSLACSSRIR